MCPIGADFKHLRAHQCPLSEVRNPAPPQALRGTSESHGHRRNISSIMRTKVLSIMRAKAGAVTGD
jgi:hypothetical protein